ncbi:MAG: HEPN domain-containing protein [Pseudonocardiaceae bacterium]
MQAAEDLATARRLVDDGESPPRLAVFLAHLAAEKALKGALIARGIATRKIHDLVELQSSLLSDDAVTVSSATSTFSGELQSGSRRSSQAAWGLHLTTSSSQQRTLMPLRARRLLSTSGVVRLSERKNARPHRPRYRATACSTAASSSRSR